MGKAQRGRWSVVSRQIITGVIIELVLVSLLMTWGLGLSMAAGVAMAALVIVVFRIVIALLSFLLAWFFRSKETTQRPLGLARVIVLVVKEIGAFLKLFFLFHAFEPMLNSHQPAKGCTRSPQPPVLFVHGFYANAGFWSRFKRYFVRQGVDQVYSLNLDPPFADIDRLADLLHQHVQQICERENGRKLVLIAHSMGGLVCRAYLSRFGAEHVSQLITLGSPHHGTIHACLLPGASLRQMRPDNDWLNKLNREDIKPGITSVYSVHDNIIAPQDSARLPGASLIVVRGIGHLSMAFSEPFIETVFDIYQTEVQNA